MPKNLTDEEFIVDKLSHSSKLSAKPWKDIEQTVEDSLANHRYTAMPKSYFKIAAALTVAFGLTWFLNQNPDSRVNELTSIAYSSGTNSISASPNQLDDDSIFTENELFSFYLTLGNQSNSNLAMFAEWEEYTNANTEVNND